MNKLFSIGNKNNHGAYIVAPDIEAAKDYAVEIGHVKKRENVTSVTEITPDLQATVTDGPGEGISMQEMLEREQCTRIGFVIQTQSFSDLMAELKGKPIQIITFSDTK